MGQDTAINYVMHSLNPWEGCGKLSLGCANCFAEFGIDIRFGRVEWGGPRRRTGPATRVAPFLWNKKAKAAGERHRVLLMTSGDFFDNRVPTEWRTETWQTVKLCRHLYFLILTKRPMNILKMLPPHWGQGWPNCWMGTSVENQEEAERRIPFLLSVPAFRRWLSVEPLLSAVDLSRWLATGLLHFIVIGGESGAGFRPMELAWAYDVVAQCRRYGVACFFKQIAATHPNDAMIPPDLLIVREFPT